MLSVEVLLWSPCQRNCLLIIQQYHSFLRDTEPQLPSSDSIAHEQNLVSVDRMVYALVFLGPYYRKETVCQRF